MKKRKVYKYFDVRDDTKSIKNGYIKVYGTKYKTISEKESFKKEEMSSGILNNSKSK